MKKGTWAFAVAVATVFLGIGALRALAYTPLLLPPAGGTGSNLTPASGTVLIGNGSGTYTPATLTPGTNILITNASGSVTIAATVIATTTINGQQAAVFHIIGDGTTVTSTVGGATTTFSIINTGNWAGTWQGVNSTTFYLASNPSAYISGNQTITLTPSGDVSGTALGATSLTPVYKVIGLNGSPIPANATGSLVYLNGSWQLINPFLFSVGTGISYSVSGATGTFTNTGVTSFNTNTGTVTYAVTCISGCSVATTTTSTAITVTAGGSGTVGPSTSTYVAVFNTSGTLTGFSQLTYTSSTEVLSIASGTLQEAPDTNASDTFAFGGRQSVGIPVPYVTPIATNTSIAFDIFPHGNTTTNAFGNNIYGAAWEDICSNDINASGGGSNYECLHLGKSVNGFANVSTEQSGSGSLRLLVLQANGGNVEVGTSTTDNGSQLQVNGAETTQGPVAVGTSYAIQGTPIAFANGVTINGSNPPCFQYLDSTFNALRIGCQSGSWNQIDFELPAGGGTYQDVISIATSSVAPSSGLDNTIPLGTASNRWSSLYAGTGASTIQGTLTVGSTTVKGSATTTYLSITSLGSSGNPCLDIGTAGAVATTTCGTVSGIYPGFGITTSPNPINTTGTVALNPGFTTLINSSTGAFSCNFASSSTCEALDTTTTLFSVLPTFLNLPLNQFVNVIINNTSTLISVPQEVNVTWPTSTNPVYCSASDSWELCNSIPVGNWAPRGGQTSFQFWSDGTNLWETGSQGNFNVANTAHVNTVLEGITGTNFPSSINSQGQLNLYNGSRMLMSNYNDNTTGSSTIEWQLPSTAIDVYEANPSAGVMEFNNDGTYGDTSSTVVSAGTFRASTSTVNANSFAYFDANKNLVSTSTPSGGGGTGANPTGLITSQAPINGSATTFLRSDGAPGFAQTITVGNVVATGTVSITGTTTIATALSVGTTTTSGGVQLYTWSPTQQTSTVMIGATSTATSTYRTGCLEMTPSQASGTTIVYADFQVSSTIAWQLSTSTCL
jgi:hypothetical protein